MMFSSKGRYALRALLDMAQQTAAGSGEYIRLSDIARRQKMSRKYLEGIMPELCRRDLVESALGKAGGYRLTRPPGAYRIGEILSAAEGELALVECLKTNRTHCEWGELCWTLPFWRGLQEQVYAYVNSYTLQDLLDLKDRETNESCGRLLRGGKGDEVQ